MISHVVVFNWVEGTTDAEVAEITAALLTLPAIIPSIRRYTAGPDAGLAAGNGDYAVVATFDDAEGWRAYDAHPEHNRIRAELIKPRLAARSAVQFEH